MKARKQQPEGALHSPAIQDADGKVFPGKALDTKAILTEFEKSDDETRRAFMCVLGHDLTVAIRALLVDRPVPDADLDRVWTLNEYMHQLTSCANPRGKWSAHDEAELLRSIVESSFIYDLDKWLGPAIATAAGSTLPKSGLEVAK